jgi:hypothetical protein
MLTPNDDDVAQIIDAVETHGRQRREQQPDMHHGDYLAGAMAVFFALGIQERIPPKWVIRATRGEDPFA